MNTEHANYIEDIKEWREWMKNLWSQIDRMLEYDMEFQVILAVAKADRESALYCPVISNLIEIGYCSFLPLIVRRLTDRSKDVISLPRLIDELRKKKNLLTKISPSGCEPERVIKRLDEWLDTEEIKKTREWTNKFIAHLADPTNDPTKKPKNYDEFKLDQETVKQAQRQIVRVAQGITYIVNEMLRMNEPMRSVLVPVPQYDLFHRFDMFFPNTDAGKQAKEKAWKLWKQMTDERDQWPAGVIEELFV
ncbi:AbiU2 domain-containing protein [Candidatus Methylacidiphilum infernorum]|uniref:HEPN AbiU2-like domain-containing protein n=1 Tax=Methylacidiphilum infernorum (isolate V4) TaxID=481448 RepID=B3E0B7_METI4|nr:hypothetical protein [Candidatus Methylacidiphilum infernorum]ACD84346.1 Conserved hypothetical protein [Methylacidiphilum infernorum V4]